MEGVFPHLFYNEAGTEMNVAGEVAVIHPNPHKRHMNRPGAAAPNNVAMGVNLDG